MRNVVVSMFTSLDGVAEDPQRFTDEWDDDVMDAHMAAALQTQDAVILGRRSYDEWAPFWPTSTIEPFATFINTVPKYVATSTPLDRPWSGASVIDGDLVEFVRDLKSRSAGDIGVHASLSVARTLLAAGLVDLVKLAVVPTIAGSGRRLFDELPARRVQLVHSATSPTSKLLLDYRFSDVVPNTR